MDKAVSDSVEKHLRSLFPAGTFTRVDVLGYGDDPDVEPGETAVRAFVDRAGLPAESWEDDEKVLQAFEKAHGQKPRSCIILGCFRLSHGSTSFRTPWPGGPSVAPCMASRACSTGCGLTWRMR